MRKLLSLVLIFQFSQFALADAVADRDAVIAVVQEFFDAMTARDADKMRSMMTPDGILYGYRESTEGLQIIRPTHDAYLENLATGEGKLVERFWDPEVMVEDRLATVWTPYDFHVDGSFSHCGVNNFSMLRTDERWIITGVVFSMQRENCEESPLGPLPAEEQ
jgi:uncharacterized protein (TIGR02246 family)